MTTKELVNLDIDSLEVAKFNAVKKSCLSILDNVASAIKDNNFDIVDKMLEYSPAGDGYGSDNHYISFSEIDDNFDIHDVVELLQKLHKSILIKENN